MNRIKFKLHKLIHWEYWPMQLVYMPVIPVWLYYAFKSRSLFFFNAANPSIKNGGMAMESKKEIYDIMPAEHIPKTVYFKYDTSIENIISYAKNAKINYPFIIKPDIGLKGLGVQIIKNEIELSDYLCKTSDDFLIQELITYPNEVGIFYCRIPDETTGNITGIVSKLFLTVTGNGIDTIMELIKKEPRSYFQIASLNKMYGSFLNTVLPKKENLILVPYGSHTRGAQFIDISHKANETLVKTIDTICRNIKGFYFGRLDIRYNTWDELSSGHNFSIIELNGAGSEPTHIYDPSHSIFFAWKEIIRHWKLLYQISTINKTKGHPYLSYHDGRKMLKANSQLEIKLRAL